MNNRKEDYLDIILKKLNDEVFDINNLYPPQTKEEDYLYFIAKNLYKLINDNKISDSSTYSSKKIDKDMKNKANSNHSHDYLPNNGGKLNGRLDLGGNDLIFMDEDSGDIVFLNEDGTTEKARIFTSGDNENPCLYISLYNRTYNLILEKDKLKINGHTFYHTGNKPTPSDIGASPKDHTHSGLQGSNQPLEIQEWIDFRFVDSNTDFDGRIFLAKDGFAVVSPNGNGKIYHEGFKPSIFDIRGMANYDLGGTPTSSKDSEYMNYAGVFRCVKWIDISEVNSVDSQATILSLPYNSGWKTQIAINPHTGEMFVRHINNSSIQFNWTKIAYTSTFSLFQEVEKELIEMELGIYQNNEVKTLNLNLETEEEKSPFDDQFKTKWWKIYKELRIKEHIQRLYNLNLITKDDYIKIVKEEPKEKYQPNNVFTKLRQDILNQDLQLLEQDLRLISIENTFNKDIKTFNISGLNNNSYNLLLRIIQNKNYKNKSEIINIIEFYHGNNKISDDNKNNLIKLINSK